MLCFVCIVCLLRRYGSDLDLLSVDPNTELCFSYHQNGLNGVRTSAVLDSKLPTTDFFFQCRISTVNVSSFSVFESITNKKKKLFYFLLLSFISVLHTKARVAVYEHQHQRCLSTLLPLTLHPACTQLHHALQPGTGPAISQSAQLTQQVTHMHMADL